MLLGGLPRLDGERHRHRDREQAESAREARCCGKIRWEIASDKTGETPEPRRRTHMRRAARLMTERARDVDVSMASGRRPRPRFGSRLATSTSTPRVPSCRSRVECAPRSWPRWRPVSPRCGSDSIDAPPTASAAPTLSSPTSLAADLVPIDGAAGGTRGRGCPGPEHRQFDFWVGNWDVFPGAGAVLAGTNEVKSLLDGCVVEENWIGSPGGHRGRSLNAFDAASGTWSQMWVDDGGCPNGDIFIEGGLVNGRMVMRGRPEAAGRVPVRAALLRAARAGRVHHGQSHSLDGAQVGLGAPGVRSGDEQTPLPPFPSPSALAGLRYGPVAQVTPIVPPGPPPSFCPFRAAATQFDFMLGEWKVRERGGDGGPGHATFSKDLNGCLVEEHFTGPERYEGLSFNTFDVFTQKWARTYLDNEGRRLFLTGGLENELWCSRDSRAPRRWRADHPDHVDAGDIQPRGAAVAVLQKCGCHVEGRPGDRLHAPVGNAVVLSTV